LIFARSTAGGANPVLAIPFNSVVPFLRNPAGETALSNRGFPSTISAHLNSRLWGAELNGLVNIWRCESVQVTGIVGGRYLDLLEHLSLTDTIQDTQRNGLAFVSDDFGTRNQFYGAQIGGRVNWNYCRFQIDATAKVAFGTVHQTMNLTGETTITNGAFGLPTGTTAQGLFVESTNRGRYNRNVFAVVPEASINFGYQLTSCIRPFIGYNWIYLGNAVRPGNQIDRNINPTQQPLIVPPGTLAGQAAPLANFRTGDFWAQGFNLGVEIRY
jgi:hypothetical protein